MHTFEEIYKQTQTLEAIYIANDFSFCFPCEHYFKDLQVVHKDQSLKKYNEYFLQHDRYIDIVFVDFSYVKDMQLIEQLLELNKEQIIVAIIDTTNSAMIVESIHLGIGYIILKPMIEERVHNILWNITQKIESQALIQKHIKVTEAFNLHLQEYNDNLNKKLEEQAEILKINQKSLIAQSRFVSMGEMVGMIAHQWKQPLNALSLNVIDLEMMHLSEKYSKKKLEEIILHSKEIIEHMTKTILDFGEFLKSSDRKENILLESLFTQTLSLIENDLKRYNINFSIRYSIPKNTIINIDGSKFTQVLINILKNAIDEFKRKNIVDPKIFVDVSCQKNQYYFTIEDNAGGISSDMIDRLFEPYVSTKGKNGTGLGMYISKLLVDNHFKGKISAENKNEGALFTLVLPFDSESDG